MKKLYFFLVLCFILVQASAQNRVLTRIANFKNDKGVCRACIFNSASSFANSKPLQCLQATPSGKTAELVFENISDGEYAIFVFHDANSNGAMDKNWLGIPKEGYGASQNQLPFAGAPRFESNKFLIRNNASLNLSIRLRNL